MKKLVLFSFLLFSFSIFSQTNTFDNLNANPLTNKSITWTSSNYGSGFGHRIINSDPGGLTLLNFQGRHNSGSWSNVMSLTSNGNVGIGTTNPQGKLEVKKSGTIGGSWNPSGSFLTISDTGSSKMIIDSNEIYGSGTLFLGSNSGEIVRFRSLAGGSTTDVMVIEANGNVGIGTTNPEAKLHVASGSQLRKTTIGLTSATADNSWIRDEWLTGSYGPAKWDQSKKKWVRPSGTYNDIGGIVYQDEGTYFLREKAGSKLEYSNSEFLNIAFMFAHITTGNVGIGTTTPDAKLTVKGDIHAEEVKIDLSVPAPDYVFLKEYDLKTIDEVETYIQQEGHLPNIPSAKVMETEGVELGIMNMKLLEKIEELTLYTIAQEKKLQTSESRLQTLETSNQKLTTKNQELEDRLAKIEALLSQNK